MYNDYYDIAKRRITTGVYELNQMLVILKELRVGGDLTAEQFDELVTLAREHADPSLSVNLLARIEDHETRLRALEEGKAPAKPEPTTPDEPLATNEYPAYNKDKAYRTGDKVTQGGKRYICQLPEYTTSTYFGPAAYPDYWLLQE